MSPKDKAEKKAKKEAALKREKEARKKLAEKATLAKAAKKLRGIEKEKTRAQLHSVNLPQIPQLGKQRSVPSVPARFWNSTKIVIAASATVISIAGIVAFLPRLSVSQEPPLKDGNMFPSYSIKNEGNVTLTDLHAEYFIWKASNHGFRSMYRLQGAPAVGIGFEKILRPTETIRCDLNPSSGAQVVGGFDGRDGNMHRVPMLLRGDDLTKW